jgi:hypothetical protein
MPPSKDPFFGRHAIVDRITKSTQTEQPTGFVIVGARMTGKSALLRHLLSQFQLADRQAPVYLDCALLERPDELWPLLYTAALDAQADDTSVARNDKPAGYGHYPLLTLLRDQRRRGIQTILLLDNVDYLVASAPGASDLCTALSLLNSVAPLILTSHRPIYDVNRALAGSRLIAETTQLFLGLLEAEAADLWLTHHLQGDGMLETVRSSLLASTGCHPYLLYKMGECLAEMEPALPPDRVWREEHQPFLRLRLAEHGRPLFLAQWEMLANPPPPLTADGVAALMERLRCGPLSPDETPGAWLPALNWLINQALVAYRWDEGSPAYTVFSPLLLDFLSHASPPAGGSMPQSPPPALDPAVYQDLTKIEANLLRYFEQHSQTLVSTDQLLADVWRRPNASTRRVQEAIRRLRLQLEQQTPPIGEIKNERGRGYRFVPAQPTSHITR